MIVLNPCSVVGREPSIPTGSIRKISLTGTPYSLSPVIDQTISRVARVTSGGPAGANTRMMLSALTTAGAATRPLNVIRNLRLFMRWL